ncbi:MAG: hypothetical protein QW674_07960 [Candidatus Bathyarchaeia archaeon]
MDGSSTYQGEHKKHNNRATAEKKAERALELNSTAATADCNSSILL